MAAFEKVFKTNDVHDPMVKIMLAKRAALVLMRAMRGKPVTPEAVQAAKICSLPMYPAHQGLSGISIQISAEDIKIALLGAGLKPKLVGNSSQKLLENKPTVSPPQSNQY